jgi:hypothetical protein
MARQNAGRPDADFHVLRDVDEREVIWSSILQAEIKDRLSVGPTSEDSVASRNELARQRTSQAPGDSCNYDIHTK